MVGATAYVATVWGVRSHVTMFYEELITLMEGVSESWQLITKEKYTTILTAMIHLHNGEPIKLLRSIYPQIWCKTMPLLRAVRLLFLWHILMMSLVLPLLTVRLASIAVGVHWSFSFRFENLNNS